MVGWMNREALERTLADRPHLVLEPEPPGVLVQGRDVGRPPVRARRLLRLRHGRAAVRRRAGGPGRVPHRRAQLLLPRVRRRRRRPGRCERASDASARRSTTFARAGARVHGRAGVARGARRPRDAAVGVREARRRPRGLPARVGRARRALGPVLVPRPRPGAARSSPAGRQLEWIGGSAARRASRPTRARSPRSRRCSQRYRAPTQAELPPFHGGIVGWIGYDTVREIERLPERAARRPRLPRRGVLARRAGRRVRPLPPALLPHRERVPAARLPTTATLRRAVRRRGRAARRRGRRARPPAAVHARAAAAPTSSPSCPRCARNLERGAVGRGGRGREGAHPRGRHLPGRARAALRSRRAGRPARGVPRAAAREPVAVHVLPAPSRSDDRRLVAGADGAGARRPRDQPPDRGHPPARPHARARPAAWRPSSSSTRRSAPST